MAHAFIEECVSCGVDISSDFCDAQEWETLTGDENGVYTRRFWLCGECANRHSVISKLSDSWPVDGVNDYADNPFPA